MPNILPDGEKLWSREGEAAVIGSMIVDPDCIPHVLAVLTKTEVFYLPEHQAIFDAIVTLHIQSAAIDGLTVQTQLKHRNALARIGGAEYLQKILNTVPSSANALYYAKIVRDRAAYRGMVRTVQRMAEVPRQQGSVNEQIEQLHQLALSLQPQKDDQAVLFKDHIAESVISLADHGRNCTPTGFTAIDNIIHGFYPWELIVVAGRPGMGKSVIAQDIALHITKDGDRAVIFSLEMGAEAIMQRAVCATARVDGHRWAKHDIPQQDFDEALKVAHELDKRDIIIYETIDTPRKMYAITSLMCKTKAPKLIILDNIQIANIHPPADKEYTRLSEISRQLKRLAMDLKVPVMAISHLNRDVEKRTNHQPKLSDLRGSGTLEQDADLVLLLHREDQYEKLKNPDVDPSDLDGLAQVIVAKNRRGRTGIATLLFREEYTTFVNKAPEYLDETVDEKTT